MTPFPWTRSPGRAAPGRQRCTTRRPRGVLAVVLGLRPGAGVAGAPARPPRSASSVATRPTELPTAPPRRARRHRHGAGRRLMNLRRPRGALRAWPPPWRPTPTTPVPDHLRPRPWRSGDREGALAAHRRQPASTPPPGAVRATWTWPAGGRRRPRVQAILAGTRRLGSAGTSDGCSAGPETTGRPPPTCSWRSSRGS
jgi:hypothetical protein